MELQHFQRYYSLCLLESKNIQLHEGRFNFDKFIHEGTYQWERDY
jgi:hypothetical protein